MYWWCLNKRFTVSFVTLWEKHVGSEIFVFSFILNHIKNQINCLSTIPRGFLENIYHLSTFPTYKKIQDYRLAARDFIWCRRTQRAKKYFWSIPTRYNRNIDNESAQKGLFGDADIAVEALLQFKVIDTTTFLLNFVLAHDVLQWVHHFVLK